MATNRMASVADLRQGWCTTRDRGSQYAAEVYRQMLAEHGIAGSMGRRGNPYDNAQAGSFMKTLKES